MWWTDVRRAWLFRLVTVSVYSDLLPAGGANSTTNTDTGTGCVSELGLSHMYWIDSEGNEKMQNNKPIWRMKQCCNYTLIFDESVVHKQWIKILIHTFSNPALLIMTSEALTVLSKLWFHWAINFTRVKIMCWLIFLISSGPTEAPHS